MMQTCCGQTTHGKTGGCEAESPAGAAEACSMSTGKSQCCDGTESPASEGTCLGWFDAMVENCYDYAEQAHAQGVPIVGIMCEFTPREIILAAGAIPASLCGGSADMIPAAEQELPANLCPLIKATYGYHLEKANPFLEWASLVVAETTCDGKKKMYERMAESRDMHILELPQKPDDSVAFDHWLCEIRSLAKTLEQRFGATITKEKLNEAIALMNRERRLKKEISYLMRAPNPPLTGLQVLGLNAIISTIPCALEQYQTILDTRGKEVGPDTATAKRVLLTGVPLAHGAERVVELIEQSGGLVVAMENCSGLKPIMNTVPEGTQDPLAAIAKHYFYNIPCSVMTPNYRRLDSLREIARDFRPDCVIELVWQACLTYDIEASRVKKLAEDELDLPYLKITTDYSPSDSARITTRIQALFETITCQ